MFMKLITSVRNIPASKVAKTADEEQKRYEEVGNETEETGPIMEALQEEVVSTSVCHVFNAELKSVDPSSALDSGSMHSSNIDVTVTTNVSGTECLGIEKVQLEIPKENILEDDRSILFPSEIEKENNKLIEETFEIPTQLVVTGDSSTNHSKIISEVLKKYPDLVKENKNIKLKIVQKSPSEQMSRETKSKISYIVLKSTSFPDSAGSVVLKKPGTGPNNFWDSDKVTKPVSDAAENSSGPWACVPCGLCAPVEFDSYYKYRRHLVDVHGERIDVRICEYCGYKASKRNLLLHHLYTKHAIEPPKNCVFPHCDRCDYVALSDTLLSKHKSGHDGIKEFSCTVCLASFKSSGALQGHIVANLHRNKDSKVYECPYCQKPFIRNINLKAHIRAVHKDIARIEEMDDSFLLSNLHSTEFVVESPTSLFIDSTMQVFPAAQPPPLVRASLAASSEAEALTNVASSIAASLGIEIESHLRHSAGELALDDGINATEGIYIVDGSDSDIHQVELQDAGIEVEDRMMSSVDDVTDEASFIVQDIHGNQFRKITGIDENGKPVIFFQLSEDTEDAELTTSILDDATAVNIASDEHSPTHLDFETNSQGRNFSVQNDHMYLDPQKCSDFVSSGVTSTTGSQTNDHTNSGTKNTQNIPPLLKGAAEIAGKQLCPVHLSSESDKLDSDQVQDITFEFIPSHDEETH